MWSHPSYLEVADALSFPAKLSGEGRYVLVLNGYFDQSGHHADSEAVVVAGYLASAVHWRAFEGKWNLALEEYGLPFFHMTDFAARVGDNADWPEDMRRARLGRLIGIINEHTFASYSVGLPKEHFRNDLF